MKRSAKLKKYITIDLQFSGGIISESFNFVRSKTGDIEEWSEALAKYVIYTNICWRFDEAQFSKETFTEHLRMTVSEWVCFQKLCNILTN